MLSGPGQFAENETNEVHTIRPLPIGYYTISRLTSVRSQAMSFRKFACISLTRPGIIARWPRIWYCELLHRFHSIKLRSMTYQVHQFLHRDPRVPYSSWNCPWASHGCQLPWLLDEDDRFQVMRLSICAFSMVLEYLNPIPRNDCDSVGPPQFGFICSVKIKAFQKCS